MVNLVGGYDSSGFWFLVLGLFLVGAVLNASRNIFLKVIGIGLFTFGGVLCTGLITYTIDKTPNLPSYVGIVPILFVVILILTVFKMMTFKKKDCPTSEDSSKE